MKNAALALAVTLAACGPAAQTNTETAPAAEQAQAGPLVDGLFAGGECYLGTYDSPPADQSIVTFLIVDPGADIRPLDTPERKHVGFAFQIKDDPDIYTGVAACARTPDAASCYLEGDGGEFTLSPTDAGGLRVAISRMEVEGPERFTPDLAAAPGNRAIDLARGGGTDCMID